MKAPPDEHNHHPYQRQERNELRSGKKVMKHKTPVLIAAPEFQEESGHGIQAQITEENIPIPVLPGKPPKQEDENRERLLQISLFENVGAIFDQIVHDGNSFNALIV